MNGCFSSTKSHRSGRCLDNSISFQPPTSSTFSLVNFFFFSLYTFLYHCLLLIHLPSASSPSPSRHQITAIPYNGPQPSHAFHGGPRRPRRPRWHGRHVQHEREYLQPSILFLNPAHQTHLDSRCSSPGTRPTSASSSASGTSAPTFPSSSPSSPLL